MVTIEEIKEESADIPKFIKDSGFDREVNIRTDEASQNIHVEISDEGTIPATEIAIYSITGYKCYGGAYQSGSFDVEIGSLQKGIYVFVITIDNKSKA